MYKDDEELGNLKDGVFEFICKKHKHLCENYWIKPESLKFGALYPVKDVNYYDIEAGDKSYNINSFEEIGWTDPFPE